MKVYVFCHLFGTHSRFMALIWHPFTFLVAYLTSIHVFCHLFGYHSRVLSLIWHPFTFWRLFGTHSRFFGAYLAPIHVFWFWSLLNMTCKFMQKRQRIERWYLPHYCSDKEFNCTVVNRVNRVYNWVVTWNDMNSPFNFQNANYRSALYPIYPTPRSALSYPTLQGKSF